MPLKPLFVPLFILPLFAMTACAKEPATSTDNSGIPQTRSNLSDDEQQQLDNFLAQQKENMQFIEGGSYEMGDFGEKLDWTSGYPLSGARDSKPLHPVTLDSFSLNAYKATYSDFDIYSIATGQEKVGMQPNSSDRRLPTAAAGIDWKTGKHYCQWLGQQMNEPVDLPTEAQWEYAARNRGEYVMFPTDTGELDFGRNVWTRDDMYEIAREYNTSGYVAVVGLYPPNPLGLYDMSNQNLEWMNDWYDEDYYKYSPVENPKGPETGTLKVARSVPADWGSAGGLRDNAPITILRLEQPPTAVIDEGRSLEEYNYNNRTSVRCAVHSSDLLQT
ncbi:MAG: formylglycine-generating enzyme family protein [Psychrobacter sp.]